MNGSGYMLPKQLVFFFVSFLLISSSILDVNFSYANVNLLNFSLDSISHYSQLRHNLEFLTQSESRIRNSTQLFSKGLLTFFFLPHLHLSTNPRSLLSPSFFSILLDTNKSTFLCSLINVSSTLRPFPTCSYRLCISPRALTHPSRKISNKLSAKWEKEMSVDTRTNLHDTGIEPLPPHNNMPQLRHMQILQVKPYGSMQDTCMCKCKYKKTCKNIVVEDLRRKCYSDF